MKQQSLKPMPKALLMQPRKGLVIAGKPVNMSIAHPDPGCQTMERRISFHVGSKIREVQKECGKQSRQMERHECHRFGEASGVKRQRRNDLDWCETYSGFQADALQANRQAKVRKRNSGATFAEQLGDMRESFEAQSVQKHWAARDKGAHGSKYARHRQRGRTRAMVHRKRPVFVINAIRAILMICRRLYESCHTYCGRRWCCRCCRCCCRC